MLDLFKTNIKHLPRTDSGSALFLWYTDGYDVMLAVVDGEFRIYRYEYWDENDIRRDYAEGEWRDYISGYFPVAYWCLDMDTCVYTTLNFEYDMPTMMAEEILEAMHNQIDDISSRIEVGNSVLKDFITHWCELICKYKGWLVYQYYK